MFNTNSLIGQSPFLSKIQSAFTQPPQPGMPMPPMAQMPMPGQPQGQPGQGDSGLLQSLIGKGADKSGLITKIISLFGG